MILRLVYIVLSTRGCSPWRPAAVISTYNWTRKSLSPDCLRFCDDCKSVLRALPVALKVLALSGTIKTGVSHLPVDDLSRSHQVGCHNLTFRFWKNLFAGYSGV